MAARKIRAIAPVVLILSILLTSGCLQDKSATGAPNNQSFQVQGQTQPVQSTAIEAVSDELDMLNSKDWNRLAAKLGRPRATTLLWYHLKKTIGFEPKVVFGYPDKLNTSLVIAVKYGGDSAFPKIKIEDTDYYAIDPMRPAIIGEFNYSYVFDDPGSVTPGYFNDFRLNVEDIATVEQWVAETGANLKYTDFPGK